MTYGSWQLAVTRSNLVGARQVHIRLDPVQHWGVLHHQVINANHSTKPVATLDGSRVRRDPTLAINTHHPLERCPNLGSIPDKQLRPVEQGLGINHVLHKEVDEFEELVIDHLVVNEFLDLVKERDFVGGCKSLLLRRENGESRLDVFDRTLPLASTSAFALSGFCSWLDTRSSRPSLLLSHLFTFLGNTPLLTCDLFGDGRRGAGSLHERAGKHTQTACTILGQELLEFIKQIGSIGEELGNLLIYLCNVPRVTLICLKDFQELLVGFGVVVEPSLDLVDKGDGMVEL